jgi:hypothetical protein
MAKIIQKNKKGEMTAIMQILLVIIFAILAIAIVSKFYLSLEPKTQNMICKEELQVSRSILQKDIWGLDAVAKGAMKHPMCITQTKEINLTKYSGDKLKEKVTIEMGNMIDSCWSTFGEGKILNTFGQGTTNWIGWREDGNYYFSCYKFKLHLDDKNAKISTSELLDVNNKYSLWNYNTKGKKIDTTFEESIKKYGAGDKNYLSYAGYVFYEGNGYIEFIEKVDETIAWNEQSSNIGNAMKNMPLIMLPVAFFLGSTPFGWAAIAIMVAGAGYDAINSFYDRMIPSSGPQLKELYPEQWYEVRYYSPYVKDETKYTDNNIVINSIKIVPILENGAGTEIASVNKP